MCGFKCPLLITSCEEPLYENALNTWISDQHWYIRGQCTQASAYMLRANTLLADLSRRLGREPAPYERQGAAIRNSWLYCTRQRLSYPHSDSSRCLMPTACPCSCNAGGGTCRSYRSTSRDLKIRF